MTTLTELYPNKKCRMTIAIEGPDRIGKHTQTTLLTHRLRSSDDWLATGYIETPIKGSSSHRRIYEMLHDGRAKQFPATFQGLQVLNRVVFQTAVLPSLFDQYDALVLDRWNASSYAYGIASGISRDELQCSLDMVADADLTIIMDGTMHAWADGMDDYERDERLQDAVRKYYIEWAERRPKGSHTFVIDANDTIQVVHETVWDIVQQHISENICAKVIDIKPFIEKRQKQEKEKKK